MPNRILKESVCTSDSINGLSWFEEVLFYRLIVNCDDYGRFDGRVAVIKNRLFPLKDGITAKSVEAGINRLVRVGLVALYVFEGKPFLYLPTWNDHQTVRAKKSRNPAPEAEGDSFESNCFCNWQTAKLERKNDCKIQALVNPYYRFWQGGITKSPPVLLCL